MPSRSDLDINQHVNNAKYVGWILESVPKTIEENYELASISLEYLRECRKDSVVESHTYATGSNNGNRGDCDYVECEHMLQLEIGSGGGEIIKVNTSSTDTQMHNNIMAAGSKDHPPMLGPGRYSQW
ncbi:palmitoyl-acyl carrier protein thioesterase, chloroplastic-like protein, partial [Tanacetum coccineum]